MPETNLPPLRIHVREDSPNDDGLIDATALRKRLPELPGQIRARLRNTLKIPPKIMESLMVNRDILIRDRSTRRYYSFSNFRNISRFS